MTDQNQAAIPSNLSEADKQYFAKYGRLPKPKGPLFPGGRGKRQFFDSADWAKKKKDLNNKKVPPGQGPVKSGAFKKPPPGQAHPGPDEEQGNETPQDWINLNNYKQESVQWKYDLQFYWTIVA